MNLTLFNQYGFFSRFFQLAFVNVFSTIMVPLAGLLSTAFLGHLSDIHQLVGVALASVLFNCLYAILYFVRMSTTGVTAQAVGRDDQETVLLTGIRNGLIALTLGLLILILQGPLGEIGFALLGGTPLDKAPACAYFSARIWGAPAVLLNYVLIGWFLGQERNGQVLVMSFVGNAGNAALSYFLVIHLGLQSAGAGWAEAISQFLMLLVGLIYLCLQVKWQEVSAVADKIFQGEAFRSAFALNSNILIGTITTVGCFSAFQDLSSGMETTVFAQNALMMQVVWLSTYVIEGIGYATETLSGNFKGKGANEQLLPLIAVAGATSILLGITIALACIFFTEPIFGLLTNHMEIIDTINVYIQWLLPVIGFLAVAFLLDGYFLGLAEGNTVRNVSLASMGLGFVPMAFAAWHFHNNNFLWLSLAMFVLLRAIIYGVQLPRTFKGEAGEAVATEAIEAGS